MRFADIIGNEPLKGLIRGMIDQDRLPHAILLTEEGPCGAMAFALAIARYVNCKAPSGGDSCHECSSCHKYSRLIHPDLHFIYPVAGAGFTSDDFAPKWRELLLKNPYFSRQEFYDALEIDGKSGLISVAEAKKIIEKLNLKPFEADWKCAIIYLPETMNAEASNKLLKLIEEPPSGTLFILVSQAPDRIISTIRSRCQRIQLSPLSRQEKIAAHLDSGFNAEFDAQLRQLLEVSLKRSAIDTFPIWETVSAFGRERQKQWCIYAEEYIRKIYLISQSLAELSETDGERRQAMSLFAEKIRPGFYEKAFSALEKAISAIESNANSKLVFCNLCNVFLLSV